MAKIPNCGTVADFRDQVEITQFFGDENQRENKCSNNDNILELHIFGRAQHTGDDNVG